MAQKPETKFKLKVVAILKRIDELWYVKTQMLAVCGIPDIIGCYKGKFFAWELKSKKGRATKLQLYILKLIQKAGGIAEVVTEDNLDAAFKRLMK